MVADWLLLALTYLWAAFCVSLGVYALTVKHSKLRVAVLITIPVTLTAALPATSLRLTRHLSQNLRPNRRTATANPASRGRSPAQPPAMATHLRLTFAPVSICSLRMSARAFQIPIQREDESRVPAKR